MTNQNSGPPAARRGRLIILSGAGLSAESGIPTFRGQDGLWDGVSIDKVCNIRTWKYNFESVHRFYDERRVKLAGVTPNTAHDRIAAWQKRFDMQILTQNIDNLLERAGCSDVVHLHGEILKMHCTACGHRWETDQRFLPEGRCPECRSRKGVKPAVIFFGEEAPQYRILNRAISELQPQDVFLAVGTSGNVIQVGAIARFAPCLTILVNLEPNDSIPEPCFNHCIYGKATEKLVEAEALIAAHLGA